MLIVRRRRAPAAAAKSYRRPGRPSAHRPTWRRITTAPSRQRWPTTATETTIRTRSAATRPPSSRQLEEWTTRRRDVEAPPQVHVLRHSTANKRAASAALGHDILFTVCVFCPPQRPQIRFGGALYIVHIYLFVYLLVCLSG